MPTQADKKRRDHWEQQLKLAEIQLNTLRNNCRIFVDNIPIVLSKYEAFLKEKGLEPTLNLDYYRNLK
jgi:hypothetical protein